jgi:hypothetical protein
MDFLKPVSDVDQCNALLGKTSEEIKQVSCFIVRERRGGFIKEKDRGIVRHRLGNFDELLLCHTEPANRGAHIELHSQRVKNLLSGLGSFQPVNSTRDSAAFLREPAQKDILGDAEVGDQAHFLVHSSDTQAQGVNRRPGGDSPPVQLKTPCRRKDCAGQDFDERTFAGTVFPKKSMNRTAAKLKRDVPKSNRSRVLFSEVDCFEENLVHATC